MNLTSGNMQNQATINIGTIGHVAHGKTTLVEKITSISTIRYKSELERNITIKLGYANAKIYKCDNQNCPRPDCYKSFDSSTPNTIKCARRDCKGTMNLVRHVSFVDCPGHDVLMATMLNGTAIMDCALLLVAANESVPQPQTQEHVFALEIMELKKLLVIQNKIDLISREQAIQQKNEINVFIDKSKMGRCPIVPVSAQLNVNVDAVLDFLVNYIEEPKRDLNKPPKLVIIRSFDVNKPGCKLINLKGGVIGGSLVTGKIQIGDEIEIRPGNVEKKDEKTICKPILTKIISLKTENNVLESAVPGGLIGIGTEIDPYICKRDKLVGQVLGLKGKMPEIFIKIDVEYVLFRKIIIAGNKKEKNVDDLKERESLQLNIGSTTTGGFVTKMKNGVASFLLQKPACCEIKERIAMSRKFGGHFRLIGSGMILSGECLKPVYD